MTTTNTPCSLEHPPISSWQKALFFYSLILLVGFLAEGLALRADFYMDDYFLLLGENTSEIHGKIYVVAGKWYEAGRRMLPYFFYAHIYALFGPSSLAFHAFNLSIHLLLACLIFPMARDCFTHFKLFPTHPLRERAALYSALIFACHPLCSEAVNYARCSMIQLAAFFSLLTAWFFLKFLMTRHKKWLVLVCCALFLASISKDSGIFHATGNLLILFLISLRRKSLFHKPKRTFSILILGGIAAISTLWALGWPHIFMRQLNTSMLDEHILTQARVFWDYIGLVLLPFHLCSDHLKPWSVSLKDTETLIKSLFLLFFVSFLLFCLFQKRTRLLAAIAVLAIAPLLLRFLYMNKEVMVEYRIYPGMPWFSLLFGIFFTSLYTQRPAFTRNVVAILLTLGITTTAIRSNMWRHSTLISEDAFRKYPLNTRPLTQIQEDASQNRLYQTVLDLYKQAKKSYQQLEDYNKKHKGKKAYDYSRAYENLTYSEQYVGATLYILLGKDVALNFLNDAIKRAKKSFPYVVGPKRLKDGTYANPPLLRIRDFILGRKDFHLATTTKPTTKSSRHLPSLHPQKE